MKDAKGHVGDLLPAYLNGTLSEREERRVGEHLGSCAACRAGLASWEAVREAVVEASASSPAPPALTMDRVWDRIEREDAATRTAAPPLSSRLVLAWQLLAGQLPLVRREIWVASAVTMAAGCLVALLLTTGPSAAGTAFAVFAPVIAAVGVAFVYGPENDPALEIALSTPTPPRLVLLARLVLVYGYDLALALAATGVLALAKGGTEPWPLVSLWIGPMLFLSALTLLLSLIFGSTTALCAAMALWGARLAAATHSAPGLDDPARAETVESLWRANATLLPLAALLLAAAIFLAPYRSGPARARVG